MSDRAAADRIFKQAEGVVHRCIRGVSILVPITGNFADVADGVLTLNETGESIWGQLDGTRDVRALVDRVVADFDTDSETAAADVMAFLRMLMDQRLVVEVMPEAP